MSLTNQLSNDNYGQIYYTQDEEELLRSIDPTTFITQDTNIVQERQENTQELTKLNDQLDEDKQGGSIIATLASVGIPLLIKNGPAIINGIKNLFKKKHGGSDEMTIDMIKEAIENQDVSKYEIKGSGKMYTRDIIKGSEKIIKDVLKYHGVPVSSYEIKQELGIPKSFKRLLKSKKGTGKSNKQYIDPMHVVKWSLKKLFNDNDVYRETKPIIKELMKGEGIHGGSFKSSIKGAFMRTKSFLKKHMPTILNSAKSISKTLLPSIIQQVNPAIDKIFNKIETKNPTLNIIKNTAQETSKKILTEDNVNQLLNLLEKSTGNGINRVGGSAGSGINAIKAKGEKKKLKKPIHIQLL